MKVRALGIVLLFSILVTGCKADDYSVVLPHLIEQTEEGAVATQDADTKLITMEDLEAADSQQTTDSLQTVDPMQATQAVEPQQTDEVREQEAILFEESCHSSYAYESLSKTEQLWYRDINRTLGNLLEKQELTSEGLSMGLDESDIDRIFQCVLNDHPEYFYVEGYTYIRFTRLEKTVKLEFSGTYSMDKEKALERKAQIEEAAEPILAGVSSEASDYDKIKYIYETLVYQTEYDLNAPDNQNIYSVLVNHRSVCQGYAKALQYLLSRLKVECTLVAGTVDTGEGHAWNLVRSSGDYYYVDVTWGDAFYQVEEAEEGYTENLPQINYDYLCITTQQLLRTHTLGGVVRMPVCDVLEDNYYVREGAYFTEVNEELLEMLFQNAAASGRTDIALKCAYPTIYEEMVRKLIEEQEIFSYMQVESGSVAYAQNEKQLSMTFWVTN